MKIPNAEDALPISKSVNLPKVHKEQLCEKLLNTIPATMMSIINPSSQITPKHYTENEKISVVLESLDPQNMPLFDDQGRKNG